jgi:hypothetical protein
MLIKQKVVLFFILWEQFKWEICYLSKYVQNSGKCTVILRCINNNNPDSDNITSL